MSTITIDLQEGFADDTIIIKIDGQEMLHQANLTTDYSIGLAHSAQVEVPEGQVEIDVSIPSRRLSRSIKLDVSTPVYLGVSLSENKIEHQASSEAFIYF
jgi:hypothetical protein